MQKTLKKLLFGLMIIISACGTQNGNNGGDNNNPIPNNPPQANASTLLKSPVENELRNVTLLSSEATKFKQLPVQQQNDLINKIVEAGKNIQRLDPQVNAGNVDVSIKTNFTKTGKYYTTIKTSLKMIGISAAQEKLLPAIPNEKAYYRELFTEVDTTSDTIEAAKQNVNILDLAKEKAGTFVGDLLEAAKNDGNNTIEDVGNNGLDKIGDFVSNAAATFLGGGEQLPQGQSCGMHSDCAGYVLLGNEPGSACCDPLNEASPAANQKTCQKTLVDWTKTFYWCPAECKGGFFKAKGTCAAAAN